MSQCISCASYSSFPSRSHSSQRKRCHAERLVLSPAQVGGQKDGGGGGGFSLHFGYSIDFIGVTSDSSRLRWKASPKLKQVNDML